MEDYGSEQKFPGDFLGARLISQIRNIGGHCDSDSRINYRILH